MSANIQLIFKLAHCGLIFIYNHLFLGINTPQNIQRVSIYIIENDYLNLIIMKLAILSFIDQWAERIGSPQAMP